MEGWVKKMWVGTQEEYDKQFFKRKHDLWKAYKEIKELDLWWLYWLQTKRSKITDWKQADKIYKKHPVNIKENPKDFENTLFFVVE